MHCVTEQVYDVLRDTNVITNIDTLSNWTGRCGSYLRSIWSKENQASTDALVVLYFKLHEQKGKVENAAHQAVLEDMQRLIWLNVQTRVMSKLEGIA
ncbi:DUF6626 family protein [Terasakiella pusilla]|uniref:DUF6626 family protein n=1 Tax=Terasakiella pusilla TaxID=64973 RepID=UPI003AA7BC99